MNLTKLKKGDNLNIYGHKETMDTMVITFCSLMYIEIFSVFVNFLQIWSKFVKNHKNLKYRQFLRDATL